MTDRFAVGLYEVLRQLEDGAWHPSHSLGLGCWHYSMRRRVISDLVRADLATSSGIRAGTRIRILPRGENALTFIRSQRPDHDKIPQLLSRFLSETLASE